MKTSTEVAKNLNPVEIDRQLTKLETPCNLNPLETEMLTRLWAILMETYLAKFQSGTLPTKAWARRLKGLSPEQVKQGIDLLPAAWPPTPVEFRRLCLISKHADGFDPNWRREKRLQVKFAPEDLEAKKKQAKRNRANLQKLREEFRI